MRLPRTEEEVAAAMRDMCWLCAINVPLVLVGGKYRHESPSSSVNGGFKWDECPWKPEGHLSRSELEWWNKAMTDREVR